MKFLIASVCRNDREKHFSFKVITNCQISRWRFGMKLLICYWPRLKFGGFSRSKNWVLVWPVLHCSQLVAVVCVCLQSPARIASDILVLEYIFLQYYIFGIAFVMKCLNHRISINWFELNQYRSVLIITILIVFPV